MKFGSIEEEDEDEAEGQTKICNPKSSESSQILELENKRDEEQENETFEEQEEQEEEMTEEGKKGAPHFFCNFDRESSTAGESRIEEDRDEESKDDDEEKEGEEEDEAVWCCDEKFSPSSFNPFKLCLTARVSSRSSFWHRSCKSR